MTFAEKYYVCLGSFKSKERAIHLKQSLENASVDAFISEYKKAENEIYYRVLYDREAYDLDESNINKNN